MTRPRKQTVDWFPHSCSHGRTIFVLEKKHGIAGYAFWFKLLEILGSTEGHHINLNEPSALEYLQAYTHTENDTCLEILNLLATLGAIDPKLWEEKIIWSDNFVAGVAQAYRNRNTKIPARPDNYRQKSGSGGKTGTEKQPKPVEEGEEGKEGEEGEEGNKSQSPPPPGDGSGDASPPAPTTPPYFSCKHFEVSDEYFRELVKDYPALSNKSLLLELKKMRDWLDDNPNRHKRTARGFLKNPKSFIRNWLGKVVVNPSSRGSPNEPKGFAGIREYARQKGYGNGNE